MEQLSIGDVSRRAGIRPSAIRFYESIGLLPEPGRVSGRRRYAPDVLPRLVLIRMAKEAGFTLAEIRTMLHGFSEGTAASAWWRALAEQKLIEIDALISRAERMRRLLEEGMRCGCLNFDDCELVSGACAR